MLWFHLSFWVMPSYLQMHTKRAVVGSLEHVKQGNQFAQLYSAIRPGCTQCNRLCILVNNNGLILGVPELPSSHQSLSSVPRLIMGRGHREVVTLRVVSCAGQQAHGILNVWSADCKAMQQVCM
jgi:hypothetical protein